MKKYGRCLCALALCVAITLAGVAANTWLNTVSPALPNGGALTAAGTGAALYGWRQPVPGQWTFTFTAGQAQSGLGVFFNRSGDVLESATLAGQAPARVNGAWPLSALSAGQKVTLTVTAAEEPVAWVVELDALEQWRQLRVILQWVALSGMAFMVLFALALYRYKRENYLLYFVAYAAVMLLWGAIIYAFPDGQRTAPVEFISRLCFSLMLLGSIWLSVGLTDAQRPAWLPRQLAAPPVIAAVSLGFCVCQHYFSGWPRFILICGSMLVCLGVLLAAWLRGLPGAGLLVAGAVITTGLRPLVLFPGMQTVMYPEALPMNMIRAARIFDLPFALGCMLFICRRFALQFDRTEQLARELDQRVARRTQQLTEQTEARKSMMLNIFHDLRSPLFVLKNCLDTVESAPEMLPKMLPVMQERTAFLHGLTEDLFLAAKLEQRQILLNEEPVELCAQVESVCQALGTEAEKKGVALSVRCPAPLPVWGDSFRLRQVVQNLVTNAIYYTPAGGRVTVEALAQGDRALLRVQDTGCGIAPEDQAAVFRRYFHTTTQNKHDSSGLGLTIALDLVKLHHGDITLESQLGKGSTFTVVLPLLPPAE